jgi:hypothetical protein
MTATGLAVTESDLNRFFGVVPDKMDADVPWPYGGLTFNFAGANSHGSFFLMPSHKHVELSIHSSGELIYQLAAPRISDLRVLPGSAHDTLEISIADKDRIFIRLSPSVLITQQAGDGT